MNRWMDAYIDRKTFFQFFEKLLTLHETMCIL